MIYLDYSANTPTDPAVLEAFCDAARRFPGNPNSTHPAGQAARGEWERVTASVARMLGAEPEEVIFTSGASESNNLALKGIAHASRHLGKHIISTALEHASVGGALSTLQQQGWEIDLAEVGRDGTVELEHLAELLRGDTVLVAVSAVDSELGAVQPIQGIAALLEQYPNCRLHVDATQAVGKTAPGWAGADTVTVAAHKFYGLNGSGVLLRRRGVPLTPQTDGGGNLTLYRSGTPALALAASTEKALSLALAHQAQRLEYVRALNKRLREALTRFPGVRLNSPPGAVPHILNLSVKGVKGGEFQRLLGERGVCVSVKSACSVEGTPSKAVYAVSRDRKNALCSWRVSLSHLTTRAELDRFLEIFAQIYKETVIT